MSIRSFAVLCAAALLPGLASAEAPGAQLLGGAQALVDFCSRVDPAQAQHFEHKVLEVLGIAQAPKDILEAARRDPEYSSAYKLFQSVFNQGDVADGKRACESIGVQGVSNPPHDPPHDGKKDKDKERHDHK
jgi:hypothetical protein